MTGSVEHVEESECTLRLVYTPTQLNDDDSFILFNWQEFSWHKFACVIYLGNFSCTTYGYVQLLLQESLPSAVCLIAAILTRLVIGLSLSFTFGCICLLC